MAQFDCPNCGHTQVVDDKHLGKQASCPKCKTKGEVVSSGFLGSFSPPTLSQRCSVLATDGGPLGIVSPRWVRTDLLINKKSSLRRKAWAMNDDSMEVRFIEAPEVAAVNVSPDERLDLAYESRYSLQCLDTALRAIEVRYLLFDLWGDCLTCLSATATQNLDAGDTLYRNNVWSVSIRSEMEDFFSSFAYVARVLTAKNQILTCDSRAIVAEVASLSARVTEPDLKPRASSLSE